MTPLAATVPTQVQLAAEPLSGWPQVTPVSSTSGVHTPVCHPLECVRDPRLASNQLNMAEAMGRHCRDYVT